MPRTAPLSAPRSRPAVLDALEPRLLLAATVPTVSVTATDAVAKEFGVITSPKEVNVGVFTLTRTVTAASPVSSPLTVNAAFAGLPVEDYDLLSDGTLGDGTITFPAGAKTVEVTVVPHDDLVDNGLRTLSLTLSPPADPNLYVLGKSAAAIKVYDNDGLPTLTIFATDVFADEAAGTGVIRVTRTGDTSKPLPFSWTRPGAAAPLKDYVVSIGDTVYSKSNFTFPAGIAAIDFTITAKQDFIAEQDEAVTFKLSPSSKYNLPSVDISRYTTVRILDDEPRVFVSQDVDATTEGDSAHPAVFRVTRVGDTTLPMDVLFTTSGAAAAGKDYARTLTAVTIPAGAASATIPVIALPDGLAEGDETVTLTLAPSAAYSIEPTAAAATALIHNAGLPAQPPLVITTFSPPAVTASLAKIAAGKAAKLVVPVSVTNTAPTASTANWQLHVQLVLAAAAATPIDLGTLAGTAIKAGGTTVFKVPLPWDPALVATPGRYTLLVTLTNNDTLVTYSLSALKSTITLTA